MARDTAETPGSDLPPVDLDATDCAGNRLWLTRMQAAGVCGVDERTIRRWTQRYGASIGVQRPSGRWVYYRPALFRVGAR